MFRHEERCGEQVGLNFLPPRRRGLTLFARVLSEQVDFLVDVFAVLAQVEEVVAQFVGDGEPLSKRRVASLDQDGDVVAAFDDRPHKVVVGEPGVGDLNPFAVGERQGVDREGRQVVPFQDVVRVVFDLNTRQKWDGNRLWHGSIPGASAIVGGRWIDKITLTLA